MVEISRLFIALGAVMLLIGFIMSFLPQIRLFSLPGDLKLERGNFSFYIPITTSIILSVLFSVLLALLSLFKNRL
jgi:hypothetical protein